MALRDSFLEEPGGRGGERLMDSGTHLRAPSAWASRLCSGPKETGQRIKDRPSPQGTEREARTGRCEWWALGAVCRVMFTQQRGFLVREPSIGKSAGESMGLC